MGLRQAADGSGAPWGLGDLAVLVDRFCFPPPPASAANPAAAPAPPSLGALVLGLGDVFLHTGGGGPGQRNAAALFRLAVFSGRADPRILHGVTLHGLRLAGVALKQHLRALHAWEAALAASPAMAAAEALHTVKELAAATDLALVACHLGQALVRPRGPAPATSSSSSSSSKVAATATDGPGEAPTLAALPPATRTDLANKLLPLIDRFAQVHGACSDANPCPRRWLTPFPLALSCPLSPSFAGSCGWCATRARAVPRRWRGCTTRSTCSSTPTRHQRGLQ